MFSILLDSSNTSLTVGLAKDDILLESISYEAWQTQSEHMIPELDKLLDKYEVERNQISDVVVAIGPGSYTGVRIAITIAKTIAAVLPVKVYAISSLRCQKDGKNPSICVINARSGRSYFGVYEDDKVLVEDMILTNDKVQEYINEHPDYVVCGNTTYLGVNGKQPDIARELLSLKKVVAPVADPLAVKPVYMKD